MKSKTIKAVSLVVSVVLLLSCISAVFGVAAEEVTGLCNCGKVPVIYITGRQTVWNDPSAPDRYPVPNDTTDTIIEAAKPVLPILAKAMVTKKWDEYCDALVNAVIPFYAEYRLNPDGTKACPTSGVNPAWDGVSVPDRHSSNSIMAYNYWNDPRMDPWDNAEDLNNYIQAVKAATHHNKVSIDARCLGTTTAMTYIVRYGRANNFADIQTCLLYNGTMNGITLAGELFSGNFYLDPDGISRFAKDFLAGSTVKELIGAMVALMGSTNMIDPVTNTIEYIYKSVYKNVLPRILKATYGSTFGYWTMVTDEYFEKAIELNFTKEEQEGEYKSFIEKLRNYHYNIQVHNSEILTEMKNAGVNTAVICKYGYQVVPAAHNSDKIGDNRVDLCDQSFGATTSKITGVLSDDYIASVANKKYISPDKQVDASTCALPDCTWFIKDLDHVVFPGCVDVLMMKILRSETQITVDTFEEYPQFMLYTGESAYRAGDGHLVPLTAENGDSSEKYDVSFFAALRNFFEKLIAFFKEKMASLIGRG